jgi:hypothetical protein
MYAKLRIASVTSLGIEYGVFDLRELHFPCAHYNSAETEDGYETEASLQFLHLAHAVHVGTISGVSMLFVGAIVELVCKYSIDLCVVPFGGHGEG